MWVKGLRKQISMYAVHMVLDHFIVTCYHNSGNIHEKNIYLIVFNSINFVSQGYPQKYLC